MSDLFTRQPDAPLAERLRPHTLDDVIGQQHLIGEGKPLRVAVEGGKPHSMLLWGPPGVGKTTLARILAQSFNAQFLPVSAVFSGVKDIREAIDKAEIALQQGRATILFVDEVHRFNKAQQDAFLPHVESGLLTFIGATTENPSFEVNPALLSRAQVYVLQSLSSDDLQKLIAKVLALPEYRDFTIEADAQELLVNTADGDARRLLNLLEQLLRAADTRLPNFSPTAWARKSAVSTKVARVSTTKSPPCTNPCAVRIPMPRCIGFAVCSTAAPTRVTSPAASYAWLGRTSGLPTRAPSKSPTMPPLPSNA